MLSRQVLDPVPPLTTLRPGVPGSVRRAIERALSKVPADRFATVLEFLAALEAPEAPDGPRPKKAIVVLPFANLSPDPDNAYFADGLMEEVIADLSRVRALTVISRTSSVKLKETGWDLRRIGRELNVRYALEGSVRRAGVHAPDHGPADRHSRPMPTSGREKYSGTVDDVFDLQERLSRQIVEALRITLDAAGGPRDRGAADRGYPRVRVLPARAAGVLPVYRRGDGGGPSAGGARARRGGAQRGAVRDAGHGVRLVADRFSAATRRRPCGRPRPVPAAPSSSTRARRRASRSWARSPTAGARRARPSGC